MALDDASRHAPSFSRPLRWLDRLWLAGGLTQNGMAATGTEGGCMDGACQRDPYSGRQGWRQRKAQTAVRPSFLNCQTRTGKTLTGWRPQAGAKLYISVISPAQWTSFRGRPTPNVSSKQGTRDSCTRIRDSPAMNQGAGNGVTSTSFGRDWGPLISLPLMEPSSDFSHVQVV